MYKVFAGVFIDSFNNDGETVKMSVKSRFVFDSERTTADYDQKITQVNMITTFLNVIYPFLIIGLSYILKF